MSIALNDTLEPSANMESPSEKHSDREQYAGLRDGTDRPVESSSIEIGTVEDQIFSIYEIDRVLDAKMGLINKV